MKPSCPVARRQDYRVEACPRSEAVLLVQLWHYAQDASNTCVASHLLARARAGDWLPVGAAIWLPPTKPAARSVSEDWRNVLALSRLVVAPGEPQNAAGFLLAHSIRMLPARWHTLVTYADTRRGHTGIVYRATNWIDLGERKGDPVWLDKDGRQVARLATHSRTNAEMTALGYERQPAMPKHKFTFLRPGGLEHAGAEVVKALAEKATKTAA